MSTIDIAAKEAIVANDTPAEKASVLRTAGQRRINVIWEITQAIIAVVLTSGVMVIAGLVIRENGIHAAEALLLLSNAFFMIISQYFTRTNHVRTGGVQKDDEGR